MATANHPQERSMTPDQAVTRAERMAIMEVCGNVPPETAQKFCDQHPELYGIREVKEVQNELISNAFN